MKKTPRYYQNRYDNRNKISGLKRVTLWVPDSDCSHIKRYAKKLRIVYERTIKRKEASDISQEEKE